MKRTPEALRLLSVLSQFPDGIGYIDLADVFPNGQDASDELRRRALVVDEGNRLRVLAPLREYVAKAHEPEPNDARRADRYYLDLLKETVKIGGPEEAATIARLAPEVSNIEAIFVRSSGERFPAEKKALEGWIELMLKNDLGSIRRLERILKQAREIGVTAEVVRAMRSLTQIAYSRSAPGSRRLYDDVAELLPVVGSND